MDQYKSFDDGSEFDINNETKVITFSHGVINIYPGFYKYINDYTRTDGEYRKFVLSASIEAILGEKTGITPPNAEQLGAYEIMKEKFKLPGAFQNSHLEELIIPPESNLKYIGPSAFQNCLIETLDLRNSILEEIDEYAFSECMFLTEVYLPPTVEAIYRSFNNCPYIEHVSLFTSIKEIDEECFSFDHSLYVKEEPLTIHITDTYQMFLDRGMTNSQVPLMNALVPFKRVCELHKNIPYVGYFHTKEQWDIGSLVPNNIIELININLKELLIMTLSGDNYIIPLSTEDFNNEILQIIKREHPNTLGLQSFRLIFSPMENTLPPNTTLHDLIFMGLREEIDLGEGGLIVYLEDVPTQLATETAMRSITRGLKRTLRGRDAGRKTRRKKYKQRRKKKKSYRRQRKRKRRATRTCK